MPSPPAFKRGDFIGDRIQVIDVLGEGGFGIVYLVASVDTRSTHALKALRGELLRDARILASFRKEAQIWIDLGPHPNLVRADWVTEIGGRLYIAMEHVQSKGGRPNSLEGYLEKRPPSLAQALTWAIQFCHGMEYAVSRGVRCHRDIKPANILIGEDDVVRISDFGIAGLALSPEPLGATEPVAVPSGPSATGRTVAGSAFGTPSHMSPEQFQDAASCDERSDVYSFGVVLYQMASGGRLPFFPPPPPPGVNASAWHWHHLRALHRGAAVPALTSPLWPVVARCLAKKPAARYPTFATLRAELEGLHRTHAGVEAAAPAAVEETPVELLNRGISLGALDRDAEALLLFDRALASAPGEWRIWNSRGHTLHKLGRAEEALACFDKAIALDGLAAEPWHNKGLLSAESGRHEDALACFERAVKLNPRDAPSWSASGVVFGRLRRRTDQLAAYDRALEIDPRSGITWFNRGTVLSAAGRPAEALASYDRALACDPRYVPAWCGRGIVLSEAGRLDEALAAYDEALRIDPSDARSLYNKGNVLVPLARLSDARACFETAAQAVPAFPMPWYNRALCDYQQGEMGAARQGFEEFLRRAPDDPLAAEARRLLER
ncbi:MAG TPA: tetratricopeptide repeat protein, partial [Vicinamibacteria bacterium]|nr:tetratricopeptide repeat protein [Vicinamibacteria bacterium]